MYHNIAFDNSLEHLFVERECSHGKKWDRLRLMQFLRTYYKQLLN